MPLDVKCQRPIPDQLTTSVFEIFATGLSEQLYRIFGNESGESEFPIDDFLTNDSNRAEENNSTSM